MTALSTHKLIHLEGWGSVVSHLKERGKPGSSTEVITESRREFLQLSNTGFFRSLADKRQLSQWSIDIA